MPPIAQCAGPQLLFCSQGPEDVERGTVPSLKKNLWAVLCFKCHQLIDTPLSVLHVAHDVWIKPNTLLRAKEDHARRGILLSSVVCKL